MKNYLLDPKNGDFVIFTDGCADLTKEEMKRYGIYPKTAAFSVTVCDEAVDFSDIDQFYECLANGAYPPQDIRTASPIPVDIDGLIEDIIGKTPDHVAIYYCGTSPHISSGTAAAHRLAIEDIKERYYYRKFEFIDTMCTSNGQALMLQSLARYEGDNLGAYAKELGEHMMHLFTQREMEFSAKSGRYGALKSAGMVALSRLKLSPFMFFPSDDKLSVHGTMRRGDAILKEWVQYFMDNRTSQEAIVRIGYGHADEWPRVEKLVRLLKEMAGLTDEQIQIARVGTAIGAHTGPSVLSFFFLQKEERPRTAADLILKKK